MTKRYTAGDGRSAASKFGQIIGEAFERTVFEFVKAYIEDQHPDYEIFAADKGQTVTLAMLGGSSRQMDTVVAPKNSDDRVALLESKWLKDARHHNDKGAWMLQLREVRKKYATVRGAAAILAGYWTEGVGVMLMGEGGIKMVLVATDEEVYGTLQPYLDHFLGSETFLMDAKEMRERYPRPWDLANFIENMRDGGELKAVADTWLDFIRLTDELGNPITGSDLICKAIDDLLGPLPDNPQVKNLEISLQIDTGNTIYEAFQDVESAIDFITNYFNDPENILRKITPRKNRPDNS